MASSFGAILRFDSQCDFARCLLRAVIQHFTFFGKKFFQILPLFFDAFREKNHCIKFMHEYMHTCVFLIKD
jgi:hypothetical protein